MLLANPLVSVIVPIYNTETYVQATIQSVLDQTYSNWELILVNDGSTDHSEEIVRPFLADNRIRYIYQENGGQGRARNTGIRHAAGSMLAFLDADDTWDPQKLEAQITIMQNEEPDLVFSPIRCIDDRGAHLGKNIGSGSGFFQGFTALFLLACGNIAIPNSSVMVKRESVENLGGFNEGDFERNIEDYGLWFRLLLANQSFFGMREVLGSYRLHQNQSTYDDSAQNLKIIDYLESLSSKYPQKQIFFKFLILQRLSAFYAQHVDKQEAKDICLQKYFSNACVDTYWFEKYLINRVEFDNYLKFRRLIIRRFRRFKTFVALINE